MSEFVNVFREWRRLCNKYFDGKGWICEETCPMRKYLICNNPDEIFPYPISISVDKVCAIELEIMRWALDNPEPVYPTWQEWLTEQGLMIDGDRFNYALANTQISSETANKLNIKPKKV